MPASKVPAFTEGLDKVRLRGELARHVDGYQEVLLDALSANIFMVSFFKSCESWCGAGSCFRAVLEQRKRSR